ncbi:uncharacterized protein VSU04_013415 isoform 3-T4 [Chlamydotis macqueenii]
MQIPAAGPLSGGVRDGDAAGSGPAGRTGARRSAGDEPQAQGSSQPRVGPRLRSAPRCPRADAGITQPEPGEGAAELPPPPTPPPQSRRARVEPPEGPGTPPLRRGLRRGGGGTVLSAAPRGGDPKPPPARGRRLLSGPRGPRGGKEPPRAASVPRGVPGPPRPFGMEERRKKRSPRARLAQPPPAGAPRPLPPSKSATFALPLPTLPSPRQRARLRRTSKERVRAGGAGAARGAPLQHSFLTDVSDVCEMEGGLLGLLSDFHSGKLQAFAGARAGDAGEAGAAPLRPRRLRGGAARGAEEDGGRQEPGPAVGTPGGAQQLHTEAAPGREP